MAFRPAVHALAAISSPRRPEFTFRHLMQTVSRRQPKGKQDKARLVPPRVPFFFAEFIAAARSPRPARPHRVFPPHEWAPAPYLSPVHFISSLDPFRRSASHPRAAFCCSRGSASVTVKKKPRGRIADVSIAVAIRGWGGRGNQLKPPRNSFNNFPGFPILWECILLFLRVWCVFFFLCVTLTQGG